MANKSRPKKSRGTFFKKYSYGNGIEMSHGDEHQDLYRPNGTSMKDKDELFLPFEIILKILQLTPNPFILNHLLVCRSLYWELIKPKYISPNLKSGNLLGFLDTICGDKAACVGTDDRGIIGIGMEGNDIVGGLGSMTLAGVSDDDVEDYYNCHDELNSDDDIDNDDNQGNVKKKKQSYKDIKKKNSKLNKGKKKKKDSMDVIKVVPTMGKKKFLPKTYLKHKFNPFVKTLDMSLVVQSGKNSYISKLLRRTSESLEIFISSQASFGTAPLIAIKACNNLKVLDLRLVNESVNLFELFKSIEQLPNLEQLCFPRSSVTCDSFDFKWPENLWYLRLQGGITDSFASQVKLPSTITRLELAHCPHLTSSGLDQILIKIGFNLTNLSITYPMPKLGEGGCDRVFWYCPNLKKFAFDIAYATWELFSDDLLVELEEFPRPLKYLRIESVGFMGMCEKLTPNDITVAVDEERLPLIKSLEISAMLGWDFKGQEMEDMLSELDHHGISVFKV